MPCSSSAHRLLLRAKACSMLDTFSTVFASGCMPLRLPSSSRLATDQAECDPPMMTTVGGIDSLLRRAGDNTDAIDGAMDAARMFVEEPAPAPPGRARDCGLPFMCSSRPPPPPDPAKVILLLTLRMCASMLSRPPLRIRASEQTGRTWDGSREAIQLGNECVIHVQYSPQTFELYGIQLG